MFFFLWLGEASGGLEEIPTEVAEERRSAEPRS